MASPNNEAAAAAADSEPAKTSLEFEKQSFALAKQYNTFEVDELRDAYRNKPESLAAHYNAMSDARDGRNLWSLVGAVSIAVDTRNWRVGVAMLALAVGFGYMSHRTLGKIGETVANEIRHHNRTKTAGLEI